jgi:hypothetical protein
MITCVLCIVATPTTAQWISLGNAHPDAPVMITGGYRLLAQSANRQGTFQERPADLWRFELNPTLMVYGLPLSANILMSSEQQGIRQEINAFSLTLDPKAIERIVMARASNALQEVYNSADAETLRDLDSKRDSLMQYDPEKLKQLESYKQIERVREQGLDVNTAREAMQQLGIMSDAESFIASLPTVGVGTVYPSFSPITLNGIRMEGVTAEWNPWGLLYFNVATGTTQRPLTRLDTVRVDSNLYTNFDNSAFGRTVHAFKAGVGTKEGEHVFLTAMVATDDRASINVASDTNTALTPQKNMIGGLEFKVEPIEGMWTMQAEGAFSLNAGDLNAPTFATSAVPGFLLGLVDSSMSAYIDWALVASTTVTLRDVGTRFTANLRRIGPGFRSLGVPNLRSDVLRYDLRADQSFWKRQISASVFYRRDQDNLVPWKRSTTSITSLGVTLGLNVRKWPFLRLTYAPYVQENDDSNPLLQYVNRTTMIMGATGYSYRLGDLGASTNLNVARQWSETKNNISDFGVTTINVLQSVSFTFPLTVSGGVGLITQTAAGQPDNDVVTADASASYVLWETLTTSGGVTLAFEQDNSTRTGFYFNLNVPLWDLAVVDLRAERTLFDERRVPPILGGNYNETIVRATISKYW